MGGVADPEEGNILLGFGPNLGVGGEERRKGRGKMEEENLGMRRGRGEKGEEKRKTKKWRGEEWIKTRGE